jgi:hypothetical protein
MEREREIWGDEVNIILSFCDRKCTYWRDLNAWRFLFWNRWPLNVVNLIL